MIQFVGAAQLPISVSQRLLAAINCRARIAFPTLLIVADSVLHHFIFRKK